MWQRKGLVTWVLRWSLTGRQTCEHLSFYLTPLEGHTPFLVLSNMRAMFVGDCGARARAAKSSESGMENPVHAPSCRGGPGLGRWTPHPLITPIFSPFSMSEGWMIYPSVSFSLSSLVSSFMKGKQKLPSLGKMAVVRVRQDC